MTPTHGNDSAGDDSQENSRTGPPTVPIPLPQQRRTPHMRARRLALRHPRPARPSTVWPCAQADLREGSGLLANWLLTAVIKLVTSYTQPGQRVLLLDPAPPVSWPTAPTRTWPKHGRYAGLLEAGWTVVRLGRGIQTQTAGAHPGPVGERTSGMSAESESGPGLPAESPPVEHPVGPSADRRPNVDSATTGHGPDRYDLIIAAAEPRTLGWFRPADWAELLTPTGILAVITHSDHSRSRLTDPAQALVRAVHRAGLHYLDRIALLRVPVSDGTLAAAKEANAGRSPAPSQRSSAFARHTQVHEDLFVFARHHAPRANDSTGDLR